MARDMWALCLRSAIAERGREKVRVFDRFAAIEARTGPIRKVLVRCLPCLGFFPTSSVITAETVTVVARSQCTVAASVPGLTFALPLRGAASRTRLDPPCSEHLGAGHEAAARPSRER